MNLEEDCNVDVSNCDRRSVHTVPVLNVSYTVREKIVESEENLNKIFQFFTDKDTASLTMKIDHKMNVKNYSIMCECKYSYTRT